MSVNWGSMNNRKQVDSCKRAAAATVRDNIGHLRLRQCFPRLRVKQPTVIAKPTIGDIEYRIKRTLMLINITRGK